MNAKEKTLIEKVKLLILSKQNITDKIMDDIKKFLSTSSGVYLIAYLLENFNNLKIQNINKFKHLLFFFFLRSYKICLT